MQFNTSHGNDRVEGKVSGNKKINANIQQQIETIIEHKHIQKVSNENPQFFGFNPTLPFILDENFGMWNKIKSRFVEHWLLRYNFRPEILITF